MSKIDNRLTEINDILHAYNERLNWLERNISYGLVYYEDEYLKLKEKKDELFKERDKIINIITIEKSRMVSTNQVLDLYKDDNSLYGIYNICIHDTNDAVGYLVVQLIGANKINVGYHIYEDCRGNHYSLKALTVLSMYLYKNGIENIELFASNTNLASIKILNEYNEICPATNIKKNDIETLYNFDLNKINNKNNTKRIKWRC